MSKKEFEIKNFEDLIDVFENTGDFGEYYLGDYSNIQIANYLRKMYQENKQLKNLYRKTCEHLFNIGNDELARYFQAQINECSIFTTQMLKDKE